MVGMLASLNRCVTPGMRAINGRRCDVGKQTRRTRDLNSASTSVRDLYFCGALGLAYTLLIGFCRVVLTQGPLGACSVISARIH